MTDFETWGPPEPVTPPSCVCCHALLEAPVDGWMRCPNGHGHFQADPAENWSPYLNAQAARELAEHRAEDEATLRDLVATETGQPTRYRGAL